MSILKKLNIKKGTTKNKKVKDKIMAVGIVVAALIIIGTSTTIVNVSKANAVSKDKILVETVDTTQSQESAMEELDSIKTYLNNLEKNVNGNIELLKELKENTVTTTNNEKSTNTITTQVKTINNEMNGLSTEIAGTKTLIEDLQKELSGDISDQNTNSSVGFSQITDKIEVIKENYTTSHENITKLIKEAEKSSSAESESLVKLLNEVEKNMTDSGEENFSKVESSLAQLTQSMEDELTQSTKSISDHVTTEVSETGKNLSSQMANGFTETGNSLSLQITNGFSEVNNNVNAQYGAMSENITGQLDRIDEDLKQVFTSVSNGKKILASTLFTVHGITISEDATFEEFKQAISSIEKEYYLGVQEIPGEISYDYHHHVDGHGELCPDAMVSEDKKGGCYTIPYYHKHEGHSGEKGGCYTVPHVHRHGGNCYNYGDNFDLEYICDASWNDQGSQAKVWRCRGCGARLEGTERYEKARHHGCPAKRSLRCHIPEGSIEYYDLGCGKNKNTLEGYVTSCGLVENQIIGAHIVYNPKAVSEDKTTDILQTSHMATSFSSNGRINLLSSFMDDLADDEMAGSEGAVDDFDHSAFGTGTEASDAMDMEENFGTNDDNSDNNKGLRVISEEEFQQKYGQKENTSQKSQNDNAQVADSSDIDKEKTESLEKNNNLNEGAEGENKDENSVVMPSAEASSEGTANCSTSLDTDCTKGIQ